MSNLYETGHNVICGGLPEAMESRTTAPLLDPMYVQNNNRSAVVFKGEPSALDPVSIIAPVYSLIAMVSSGLSAYHGYKRNNGSLGWGIGWGVLGGLFPIITPSIAAAQGFGKPAKK